MNRRFFAYYACLGIAHASPVIFGIFAGAAAERGDIPNAVGLTTLAVLYAVFNITRDRGADD